MTQLDSFTSRLAFRLDDFQRRACEALEGGHGVLVNAIAPGSVLTEMTRPLFYAEDGRYKENTQRLLDHIPLGRPGEAHEIAHAALFLAAPESSYVNGHVLTVDGGWTAGYTREF